MGQQLIVGGVDLLDPTKSPATRTPPTPMSRLLVVGHSLASGFGSIVEGVSWPDLLAGLLDAELVSYARSGAVAAYCESTVMPYGANGDGGFGHLTKRMPYPAVWAARDYAGLWASGTTYAQRHVVWKGAADPLSWYISVQSSNTGHDPATDDGTWWLPLSLTDIGAKTWLSMGWLPVIMFGLNDLGTHGDWGAYINCLRGIIAFCTCAEGYIQAYDPRSSFTAGFSAAGAASEGCGLAGGYPASIRNFPLNTTDYTEHITPADWVGGYITFTFATIGQATSGVLVGQVDGTTVTSIDASVNHIGLPTAKSPTSWVGLRVPVPAGPHRVRIKQTTALAGTGFSWYTDGTLYESNPATPFLIPGNTKFINSAKYTAFYGGGTAASDANVDDWNTKMQAVLAAEYPNGTYVDLSDIIGPTHLPNYYLDGAHVGEPGHVLIAERLRDKAQSALAAASADAKALMARPSKVGRVTRVTFGADLSSSSTAGVAITTAAGWTAVSYTSSRSGWTSGGRNVEGAISADPGDIIEIGLLGGWNNEASAYGSIDLRTVKNDGTYNQWVSQEHPWYAQPANGLHTAGMPGQYEAILPGGPIYYKVHPLDIQLGGSVVFRLFAKATGATRTLLINAVNPLYMSLRNIGQAQPYYGGGTAR